MKATSSSSSSSSSSTFTTISTVANNRSNSNSNSNLGSIQQQQQQKQQQQQLFWWQQKQQPMTYVHNVSPDDVRRFPYDYLNTTNSNIPNESSPLLLKNTNNNTNNNKNTISTNNILTDPSILQVKQQAQQRRSYQKIPSVPSILEIHNDDNDDKIYEDYVNDDVDNYYPNNHNNLGSNSSKNNIDSTITNIDSLYIDVIVHYIGEVDMTQSCVPVTFTVTMSWKPQQQQQLEYCDQTTQNENNNNNNYCYKTEVVATNNAPPMIEDDDSLTMNSIISATNNANQNSNNNNNFIWKMQNSNQAILQQLSSSEEPKQQQNNNSNNNSKKAIDLPPLSILNAIEYDTLSLPEVHEIYDNDNDNNTATLLQWTCQYRAMLQQNWDYTNFPHDAHYIQIKLAILEEAVGDYKYYNCSYNYNNDINPITTMVWDNKYKIDVRKIITSDNNIQIPGFYSPISNDDTKTTKNIDDNNNSNNNSSQQQSLFQYDIIPVTTTNSNFIATTTSCIEISIPVFRNSTYFDRNIIPLLAILNMAAISIVALDPIDFGDRAFVLFDVAFCQIGMRITHDAKLPQTSLSVVELSIQHNNNKRYNNNSNNNESTNSSTIKIRRIMNEYMYIVLFLVIESVIVYLWKTRQTIYYTDFLDGISALIALSHNAFTLSTYYYDARKLKQHYNNYKNAASSK